MSCILKLGQVNICYFTALSIRADIVCRCVFVAFLDFDLCKRYVITMGFPHRYGYIGYESKRLRVGDLPKSHVECLVYITGKSPNQVASSM